MAKMKSDKNHRIYRHSLLALVFILLLPFVNALTVIPNGEGFGINTVSSRGGEIINVTNLDASGAGSLKECVDTTGARTCVFQVSGTIVLSEIMKIRNPYLRIAGQTAPSPGITIRGAGLEVQTNDVLIEHIRIRVGDDVSGPTPDDRDALSIVSKNNSNNLSNVVFSHVSTSWAIDEIMSISSGSTNWFNNVTITDSIISEALYDSLHSKGPHSMGMLIGRYSENILIKNNIFAMNNRRNPLIRDDTKNVIVANNLIFHSGTSTSSKIDLGTSSGNIEPPLRVDAIGNKYISSSGSDSNVISIDDDSVTDLLLYVLDNVGDTILGTAWEYVTGRNDSALQSLSRTVTLDGLTTTSSDNVENNLITNSGARPQDRDTVDNRIISSIVNRTGSIIDSQNDVGGWPNLDENTRLVYLPTNPNSDDDLDGYTNFEEILHLYSYWIEEDFTMHPSYKFSQNYSFERVDSDPLSNSSMYYTLNNLQKINLNMAGIDSNISILYDNSNLYILGEIIYTDLGKHNSQDGTTRNNDGIEIQFDNQIDSKSMFVSIYNSTDGTLYRDDSLSSWNPSINVQIYNNESETITKTYLMKVKIPFSDLGINSSYTGLGFDLHLVDYNSGTKTNSSWSNLDNGTISNVEGFGSLIYNQNSNTLIPKLQVIEDLTQPIILNSSPSENLSGNISSLNLTIETDEISFCKYDTDGSEHYLDMENLFVNTNSTNHTVNLVNLSTNSSYTYYVRCRDASFNVNSADYVINFDIGNSSYVPQNNSEENETQEEEEQEDSSGGSSGGGGGGGGGSSSSSSQNIFSVSSSNDPEESCVANYERSEWSTCENGERSRVITDLNGCFEEQIEVSFCKDENSEIDNKFLNAKPLNVEKTDLNDIFKTTLEASYNEIFVSETKLGNGNNEIIIVIDESTGTEYLSRLVEEEGNKYYYTLERIDVESISELKAVGLVETPLDEKIDNSILYILRTDSFPIFINFSLFMAFVGVVIYLRKHAKKVHHKSKSHWHIHLPHLHNKK